MLTSDQISTKSPMSMSGFTSRYLRVTKMHGPVRYIFAIPKWAILFVFWILLLVWNFLMWVVFFWFTIIWRHYRNGVRRDKRTQAQHRELLEALKNK